MSKSNKQKDTHFDSPEYWAEIEDAIISGKVTTIPNFEEAKQGLMQAARNTRLQTQQVSVRMNKADLSRLKAAAIGYGMPYQTLLNSLVHRFVTGKLTL